MKRHISTILTLTILFILSAVLSLPGRLIVTGVSAQTKDSARVLTHPEIKSLPSKEKRWALIIGIDEYEKDVSSLKGAVNDARSLKDVLVKHAGFPENQIIVLTSDAADPDNRPKRENILGALSDLSARVPNDGLLLFSFSGHGVSVDNQAFLIPSNGRITRNLSLLKSLSINVMDIKEAIQEIKVKQVLMLLDACRNEPGRGDTPNVFTAAYMNGFSFDVANSAVKAFATLYATDIGERAYEFYDRETKQYRGYFSYAIEEALKGEAANDKGEVTLRRLIDYLETTVPPRVKSGKDAVQVPSASLSETYKASELILSVAPPRNLEPIKPVNDVRPGEIAYWQAIENSNEISDFEDYLARSERGEFADIFKATAELKLYRLRKANAPLAWAKFKGFLEKVEKYSSIRSTSDGMFEVSIGNDENRKHGLIDGSGNEVISTQYDSLSYYRELAEVKLNNRWGIFDKVGREVIPIDYDYIYSFSEGLAEVKSNGKSGFVDKTGRVVIPLKYDSAKAFLEGLAQVELNNKYSFIDKTGKEVTPLKYDFVKSFSDGLAVIGVVSGRVSADGGKTYSSIYKKGFVNKMGKEIIPMKYDEVEDMREGVAPVRLKNKWGVIDKTGREIIPIIYNDIGRVSEGVVTVKLNGKVGFIDISGREVIPPIYDPGDCSNDFSEGLAIVRRNGKSGSIDKTGKEVIPLRYDHLHPFEKGWAIAGLAGKYGYIDQTGEEVIRVLYQEEFSFWEGFAAVKLNDKYGFIDRTGREVTPIIYDETKPFSDGFAAVKLNNKWGFIDKTGKEIVPIKYDEFRTTFITKGFIGVTINGKNGFVDLYGNEYFDF